MHTIFIIFGSTGDLAKRKLFPALYNIFKSGKGYEIDIIGVGRRDFSPNEFIDFIDKETTNFISKDYNFKSFLNKITYSKVELSLNEDYKNLSLDIDKLKKYNSQIVIYLSIAPEYFGTFIDNSKVLRLGSNTKIVFEKPFGTDLASSMSLNKKIIEVFNEEQIYRIDHYVGKEAIQNILAFRFTNTIFEPIWSNKYIDNIQITASESIGVGERGGYYEKSGALRDMVQNHLFQVLSLVVMEPPSTLDDISIMQEKLKIFKELKLTKDFKNNIVFGQYDGYLDELGISKNSRTETFVALKLEVCNWRFIGVPIYLKTGKYLDKKTTKIVIEFKEIPNLLFRKFGHIERNRIILEVQPDESISIHFNVKQDGESQKVERVRSIFSKEIESKEAYEKLLEDVILGDKTLFTSFDMLKQTWTIVDDLVNCLDNCPIIHKYEKGSSGPIESDELLHKDGRKWYC